MTIYKRRQTWWVEYQVDGKRYRQSTHTHKYAVAVAWANQIETARKMPTFEEAVEVLKMFYKKPVEGLLPIDATWDIYLELAKATGKTAIESATMTRRENTVKRLIKWLHAERPTVKTIEAVTGPIAAGFATYLTTLKGRGGNPLKSKARINIIADLTTVWKLLETASTGVRNPWPALRPQDIDGERGKAFTPEDEERVLEAAGRVGKDWLGVCTIMRHTALRYEDVALLTWDEIDGDVIRLDPKKTKRHKIAVAIPIIAPIRKVLDAKRGDFAARGEAQKGDVDAACRPRLRGEGDAYLFPLHAELYGNRGRAAREILNFREVLKAAGIDGQGYTVHSWRHTAATRLAEAGADLETRKALLGHRVDATAERYDHDEHLEKKRAALERAAL